MAKMKNSQKTHGKESSLACQRCKRNRILPSCQNCINRHSECSYPLTAEKPGPKLGTHHRKRVSPQPKAHPQQPEDVDVDVDVGVPGGGDSMDMHYAQQPPTLLQKHLPKFLRFEWEQLKNTERTMISRNTPAQANVGLTGMSRALTKSEIEREEIKRWEAELAGEGYIGKVRFKCQGLHHIQSLVDL